jgi:serine-type D-Ala-D-Ala carboxypeptidase/endopeptidase (penicillin-binding protein 4)
MTPMDFTPTLTPSRRERHTRWQALAAGLLLAASTVAGAQAARGAAPASPVTVVVPGAAPVRLPTAIGAALAQARLPADNLYLWVADAGASQPALSHQADRLVAPASLMKLITSAAALERLGPAHQWRTTVHLDSEPRAGVLQGSVYLKGGGDPRLVTERLWLLLRQLQQRGVRDIRGDIVLDRSAYDLAPVDPAAFDGEPHRPYNVQADALLVNQHAVMLQFRPDAAAGIARLSVDPPLTGLDVPGQIPLRSGPCNDWRAGLQADVRDPERWRFGGGYPLSCGERSWPLAYPDPARYASRAITAQWQALGGKLQGQVREGRVPEALALQPPALDIASPPLGEVLRDMNKFSSNVIAQHVLLALSPAAPARFEAARASALTLLPQVGCAASELVLDRGSGLSRDERITPQCLGAWLQWAWRRPWMPEFYASLPLAGIDGTARRMGAISGRAHLKTGSLVQVAGIAGIAHPATGRPRLVVALIQDPLAGSDAARAVLESVVQWALDVPSTGTP